MNVGTTEPVNFTDTGASAKVNAQIQASDDIDFTATQKATMSTTVGTAQTGDSYAEVTNATYGLSALNTKVGTPADTDVSTDIANVALELAKVPKSDSNVTFNATALGDIKTQAVAALNTDTYAEPGQEAPAATNTLVKKIGYLFKAWRNLATQTATDYKLYNDAGAVVDQKATTSDDGTTFTRTEIGTGP